MEIKELGHVVLYVRDLATSRTFYRDTLGFREIGAMEPTAAAFSTPRTHHELLLLQVGEHATPVPAGRRLGMYHFGLKIGTTDEELQAALSELRAKEVNIVGTADHGVTHSLYITDPDGNEIELYIDVQPEEWRKDPSVLFAPPKPLRISE